MKKIIKKTTPGDWILLLFLSAASITGIFIARVALPASADVVIEIDGRPAFTSPLREDRLVTVQSLYGPVEVEIKNSRVRVKEAHCPNRLCIREGWVSKGVIVCLPGRVVVFVGTRDPDRTKDLDAVTG